MNRFPSLCISGLLLATACATTSSQSGAPSGQPTAQTAPAEAAHPTAPEPTRVVSPDSKPIPHRPLRRPKPLQLVVQPDPAKPIVSFRLVFNAGSVDDPKGKEGLTALTTRLLAEGGTKELSSAELLQALFPMAAELSASTDKELTVFAGRVHQDKLDRFFKIFTDVLLEPRLDAKELDRLRTDMLNAIRNELRGENDEELGKVALDALLYEGHPYAHYTGGTVEGLTAITLDDIRNQWRHLFTQDRLVVGLAGPVDKALEEKVRTRLAALPATGEQRVGLPAAPGVRNRALLLKKDALSTAISEGYSIPLRRGDPDFYEVAFALSYLGEHRQFHGVLFSELREKRGLNYGNYAYPEHFHQEGWSTFPRTNVARSIQDFSIWLRPVEPQNAIFAARGAQYFLERLVREGIPRERFEVIRGFLSSYTRLWEQTDQRRLGYAIDDLFYGTSNYLESYRQAMAKMTPETIHAAIRRHLDPSKLNFVFVANDPAALADTLHKQPPTPITYPSPKAPEIREIDKAIATQALPVHPSLVRMQEAASFMESVRPVATSQSP